MSSFFTTGGSTERLSVEGGGYSPVRSVRNSEIVQGQGTSSSSRVVCSPRLRREYVILQLLSEDHPNLVTKVVLEFFSQITVERGTIWRIMSCKNPVQEGSLVVLSKFKFFDLVEKDQSSSRFTDDSFSDTTFCPLGHRTRWVGEDDLDYLR